MLIELTIKNVALIEHLRIEFDKGFNVLTGETGTGKSIVVDSINLVLGGRADRDLIRTDAEKASVQALFDISGNQEASAILDSIGIEPEDGLITITREINRSGRNICRICESIVQLGFLKTFTSHLMDVHGQHEHQSLMNPANHMVFLDSFGSSLHREKLLSVSEAYHRRNEVKNKLKNLMRDSAETARLADVLKFQANEIASAKLKEGEESALEAQLKILENTEKIRESVETAYRLVYTGVGSGTSAQEALLKASSAMQHISGIDEQYRKLAENLQSLYYSVQEIGMELQSITEELPSDPAMLDKISARLDLISKLERKYGSTEAEVIAFGKEAKRKLDAIDSSDDMILQLKKDYKKLDAELRTACDTLSESRKEIAENFEKKLLEQLSDLGMGKSRFQARITPLEKPAEFGCDSIEFLIAPNSGEPLKPLSSTASGGELSRVMLAFKVIALNGSSLDSMVFDEIDTGVSGRTAQVVGEKMKAISLKNQVLCVTHLPQIAALADMHFCVSKHTENGRTVSCVVPLDREGRISEIARLVGGSENDASSLSHAEHMIDEGILIRNRLQEIYS